MEAVNTYLKVLVRIFISVLALNCVLNHANAGANECEPIIKTVYKTKVEIVYVEVPVEKPIEIEIQKDVTRKNRVSLLVLNGPSDDVSRTTTPTSTTLRHEDRTAVGGQYMRDLGRFNLLIQGDTNKNVGLGLGLNF